MNFHQLLQLRDGLLRQSRLANVAFAWHRLAIVGDRIATVGLHGRVCLRVAEHATEAAWPLLTALEGSQAVIDEHFTDEDVIELADLIAFAGIDPVDGAHVFRLEDLVARFGSPLRRELERAGIRVAWPAPQGLNPSEAPRLE